MSMCIGKLLVNMEGNVEDLPYAPFGTSTIVENRNIELGPSQQSLPDVFLSKLLEGLLGKAEVFKDGENIRIEYTDTNSFWLIITKTPEGYVLEGGEPAA